MFTFLSMKKILRILGPVLLIVVIYFGFTTYPKLDIISGFAAKSLASGHFIDHRSQEMIEQGDNDISLVRLSRNHIDNSGKWATASVYGFKKRKAIYREGLGAILINSTFDISKPFLVPQRTKTNHNLPFPYGNSEPQDTVFHTIDYAQLEKAVNAAFDENNEKKKRSRSVLVLHKDQIIVEKYADGFNKNSKIVGWSMTKSITATYFGILQKQGKLDLNQPAPIREWKNDSRASITINNLLRMNSGLEWEEDYSTISDVTKMLFLAEDMGQIQLEKPAEFKPGAHWNYSSGTTNLLSKILRNQFKTHQEYLDFWYSALIDKIGMHSMLIESDMAGNFVGSSYGWATTRDWAKFGLLYLRNGNWNGEPVFDPGWSKYVAAPTIGSDGRYGAHFWLNSGGKFPDVPRDMYYCSGYQGQMVAMIPSHDLVIVRMGLTEDPDFDFNGFLKGIIESVPAKNGVLSTPIL